MLAQPHPHHDPLPGGHPSSAAPCHHRGDFPRGLQRHPALPDRVCDDRVRVREHRDAAVRASDQGVCDAVGLTHDVLRAAGRGPERVDRAQGLRRDDQEHGVCLGHHLHLRRLPHHPQHAARHRDGQLRKPAGAGGAARQRGPDAPGVQRGAGRVGAAARTVDAQGSAAGVQGGGEGEQLLGSQGGADGGGHGGDADEGEEEEGEPTRQHAAAGHSA
mmetsp:Transcript_18246/g.41463  ORF Transcript_18246/g.41463 Transcript_18246/m.41463 type:complete len:217 (+) Transcript_18246:1328-1978(+)